jgi:hypothetical protein
MAKRPRTATLAAIAGAAALALAAPPVSARDPGRWLTTGVTSIPLTYFQGVTADRGGRIYFDGLVTGLWRTTRGLRQTGGNPNAIPPDVNLREGYNHIGDISWDRAEGGRLLLPLECFVAGRGNTCGTGSIGVAGPRTLRWRYYVKLDPAEIPKAMWVEISPDGRLLWTSSGDDLLAYRARDVSPAHAAPAAPPIRAVRRLRGAVPPSGITGATFLRGRLFLAGQETGRFQVWSVDLRTGGRRLEIERRIAGESEGLGVFRTLGGVLHWMVMPVDPRGRRPTYGPDGALLHFVRARGVRALRVSVSPRRIRAGGRARVRVRVTCRLGRVRGALVSLAGRRARTDRRGRATLVLRLHRGGTYRALAVKRRLRGLSRPVRVAAPPGAVAARPRIPPGGGR